MDRLQSLNTMLPELVRATILDLEEVRSWVQRYFAFDALVFDDAVSTAIQELLEHPEMGTIFFVSSGGVRAGYAVMTAGFDHEFGGRMGVVTDLFLDEPFRGQGLGPQVVDLLTREARSVGYQAIELFVLDHNHRARKMYERAGFTVAADRCAMYKILTTGEG